MLKHLLRSGFLSAFIILIAQTEVFSQGHQPFIIDNAKILTPEQHEELNFILNGYYNAKKVEFVFFTTKSLGGKSVDAYCQNIIRNFGIGRQGINSGLLFFIALEEKKVSIQVGHGLEWQITEAEKDFILDQTKSFLREGDFYTGAKESLIQCYELIKGVPWNVSYDSFKELGYSLKSSMNNIVSFSGTSVTKNILHSRNSSEQFSPKYFITIKGDNERTARLYYSINMVPIVEQIISGNQSKIYARVTRTGPVRLDLLGIE